MDREGPYLYVWAGKKGECNVIIAKGHLGKYVALISLF